MILSNKVLVLFFLIFYFLTNVFASASQLSPAAQSEAYRQFALRPKTELSKLLYLMDCYRDSDYKVIYDGYEYDAPRAVAEARKFIAKKYKGEPAEKWLKVNAYRSGKGGNVILMKFPGGERRPLRDVLIDELKKLGEKTN